MKVVKGESPAPLNKWNRWLGEGKPQTETRKSSITFQNNILLIIGDFNAKIGRNNKGHESGMVKHGIGERNEHGER